MRGALKSREREPGMEGQRTGNSWEEEFQRERGISCSVECISCVERGHAEQELSVLGFSNMEATGDLH